MSNRIAELLNDPIVHYPTATVACFDPTHGELPRRKLHATLLTQFLERLSQAGAPAVLIGASTGHGHLRTVHELEDWFAMAANARLENCLKMALLRPEDGTLANQHLARQLKDWNYSVVFVRPGNNVPQSASDDEVYENLLPAVEAIAAVGLPIGLYSIPDVSGVPLSVRVAERIAATRWGNQLVAIKITESNFEQSTLKFLRSEPLRRLKIVQGWDPFLAQALQIGPQYNKLQLQRCGVTSGPMSFAVFQYLHLLQAAQQHDWEEVTQSQDAVSRLFRAMQDNPLKFADLQRAKYIMGLGHPLLGQVTAEQTSRVMQALEACPRPADRSRLARSLMLMPTGPMHEQLQKLA